MCACREGDVPEARPGEEGSRAGEHEGVAASPLSRLMNFPLPLSGKAAAEVPGTGFTKRHVLFAMSQPPLCQREFCLL